VTRAETSPISCESADLDIWGKRSETITEDPTTKLVAVKTMCAADGYAGEQNNPGLKPLPLLAAGIKLESKKENLMSGRNNFHRGKNGEVPSEKYESDRSELCVPKHRKGKKR